MKIRVDEFMKRSCSKVSPHVSRSMHYWLAMALVLALGGKASAQSRPQSTAGGIYDKCHVSVVVVVTLDADGKAVGQGSGFILSTDRVVTNHHVLADAANAVVIFADGKTANVDGSVADSPSRDISIVSVKTGNRPPLKAGDELSLRQGDEVYAIGAPRGLDLSITNGIVSGFRNVDDQFLLQTTAPIAPGSSGGPLFDRDGAVIGVTTSLLSDSPGIYFSVGIGDVTRITRSASTLIVPLSNLSRNNNKESASKSEPEVQSISDLISAKDYDSARSKLEPLISKAPDDPTLNRLLGEVDFFQGKSQLALAHLKKAVDRDFK
jgi:S1-C subfamily serine protease